MRNLLFCLPLVALQYGCNQQAARYRPIYHVIHTDTSEDMLAEKPNKAIGLYHRVARGPTFDDQLDKLPAKQKEITEAVVKNMKEWGIASEEFSDHTTVYEGEDNLVQIARAKGKGKEPAITVDEARKDPEVGARMRLYEQAHSLVL